MQDDSDQPLKDEAAAREEWRGTEEAPMPDSPGHTLPAGEDKDEQLGSGGGDAATGSPGTIRPPD